MLELLFVLAFIAIGLYGLALSGSIIVKVILAVFHGIDGLTSKPCPVCEGEIRIRPEETVLCEQCRNYISMDTGRNVRWMPSVLEDCPVCNERIHLEMGGVTLCRRCRHHIRYDNGLYHYWLSHPAYDQTQNESSPVDCLPFP